MRRYLLDSKKKVGFGLGLATIGLALGVWLVLDHSLLCILDTESTVASTSDSDSASAFNGVEQSDNSTPGPLETDGWTRLAEGLFLGHFRPTKEYENGRDVRESLRIDHPIVVLRVDPDQYAFRLLCESEVADGKLRSVEEWAEDFGILAAINASMFRQDFKTSTGFMKNFGHLNNQSMTPNYKAVFAFNHKGKDVPEVQIIDLQHQDFDALKDRYNTLIQGLRMISSKQTAVWGKSNRIWSTAALAIDSKGNVLLIHSRTPYSVYDFNDILLSHPALDIYNTMYLEGGPEASMYIHAGGREISRVGSYETNFNENNDNNEFWSLPNVIGLEKKMGNDDVL